MFNTKLVVSAAIAAKYKELGLTPESRDHWVQDTRSGNLIGPYLGRAAALILMKDLNEMVARNPGQPPNPFTTHGIDGTRVDAPALESHHVP